MTGWSQNEAGEVVLTMQWEEWEQLLNVFGYAHGSAIAQKNWDSERSFMTLFNRLNRGNPGYTPYEVGARCGHCGVPVTDPVEHDCLKEGEKS